MANLNTLIDDFSSSSVDSSKWDKYGGTNVQNSGGQLLIQTSKTSGTYRGLNSHSTYDLTGSYAQIQLVSIGSGASLVDFEAELKVEKNIDTNSVQFTVTGNDLVINKTISGVITELLSIPYINTVHRYLRIRESSGTTYWDYSTDGVAWTNLYNVANLFVVTSVYATIQAGTYSENTSTTYVKFDDFNIIPATTTEVGMAISNPIEATSINKTYEYRVYDYSGNFLGSWDDVSSDFNYTQEINSPGSSVEVELARSADKRVEVFNSRITVGGDTRTTVAGSTRVSLASSTNSLGSGTNVELRNKVKVYVYYGGNAQRTTVSGDSRVTVAGNARISSVGSPSGRLKFQGYISKYQARYGDQETTKVTLYSYGAELNNYMLNNGGSTTVAYSSSNVSSIFQDILDKFTFDGGTVDYDSTSVDSDSNYVSYTFNTDTYLEAIKKVLELAPTDWYWYLDMANNILHFHQKPETAKHTFVLGKHIKSLNLDRTIEDLVNTVYFVGGDTGGGNNLFVKTTDNDSVTSYGAGLYRYSDNRVTNSISAGILSDSYIARNKDPQYRSQVQILSGSYDIEDIGIGDMIQFRGFNNFVDTLLMQVVALSYSPDFVTLQLDSLLPAVSKRVEDIKRNLSLQENLNNPTAPS